MNQDVNDMNDEFDDDAFEEESWDDGMDDDMDDTMSAPPKKKNGGLIMGLLMLGVVGGGAYIAKDQLMPMLGLHPQPVVANTQQQGVQGDNMLPPSDTAMAFPGEDMQQMQQDPFGAADPSAMPESDPIFGRDNAPVMADNPFANGGDDMFPPQPNTPDETAEENSVTIPFGSQSIDQAEATENESMSQGMGDNTNPFASTGDEMPSDDSPFGNASITQTDDDVVVDDKAVDTAVAEASTDTSMPTDTTKVQQLEDQIKTLEAKLAAAKDVEAELDKAMQENMSLKNEISSLNKKLAAKPARSTASKAAPKAVVAKPVSIKKSWVLRSAKPGQAWVSEKGQNEMKQIRVGDQLTGLGTIKSIEFDTNSGWIVKATKGTVKQ